ncbi:MAG: hypothetical protein ABL952_07835 [Pyrinomonadaceae bacterium]
MNEERENLKRLRKMFQAAFAERMNVYGFDRRGGGMYYRKTDFGRKGVMILDNIRLGTLQVSANMAVTLTDVEAALFEYRTKIRGDKDENKPNIQTVSKNLGNIKIGMYRYWNNYNDEDIAETIDSIEVLVRDYGLAFLETVDTPEKVLKEILETTRRKTKLGHPTYWWEKGFVLMMLLKRRDLFDEYLPIFDKRVENTSTVMSDYVRFRDWIKSNQRWNEVS